jgi:mitochondrial chaperone BCS1
VIETLLSNQVFMGLGGATVFGALLFLARQAPGRAWGYVRAMFSVSIETQSTDVTFYWLVKWLAVQPYSAVARRLRLSEVESGGDVPQPAVNAGAPSRQGPKFLLSPGNGMHFFFFGGTPVLLNRVKDDNAKGESYRQRETMTLTVFARNRRALLAIIDEAYAVANQESKDRVRVHFFDYDSWQQGATARKRAIESVVLRDGIREEIVADVERFLASREWYEERGVPYRRGYLLYGPPGTGKSSLVAALASRFDMGVAMMSLAGFASDDAVVRAMRRQPERSILLIEDVDAAIGREEKDRKVTFSAVLNSLDGLAAPEGRIVVMTTNHRERLDPALIRPGRIDLQLEIGLATAEQASRMFERHFGDQDGHAFGALAHGLSPARIQEVLMASLTAFDALRAAREERAA